MTKSMAMGLFLFILLAFIYFLQPILAPFLMAGLIAYLGDPLVEMLAAKKWPRSLSVTLLFVIVLIILSLALFIVIPLLEKQMIYLINILPKWIGWVDNSLIPYINNKLSLNIPSIDVNMIQTALKKHWQQAGTLVAYLLESVSGHGLQLMAFFTDLLLIPVVAFYLLRDWPQVTTGLKKMLPKKHKKMILDLASQCHEILCSFFRGQLMVMFSLGLFYAIGLWLIGVPLALLVGFVAGLLTIVPYLGFIVGFLLATGITLFHFHDLWHLIMVVIFFMVAQVLEGFVLTPLMVGDKIGLHPVAVIFAILAGGQLLGFVGVLIALPVAAMLWVIINFFFQRIKKLPA